MHLIGYEPLKLHVALGLHPSMPLTCVASKILISSLNSMALSKSFGFGISGINICYSMGKSEIWNKFHEL